MPLDLGNTVRFYDVPGVPAPANRDNHRLELAFVSPTYFSTMEIGILEGRGLAEADRAGAAPVAVVSRALAASFWPGPLTLALTAPEGRFPPQVVGSDGAVAVRVSPHPAVTDVLAAAGGPVTSTSANRPGQPPARTAGAAAAGAEIPGLLVLDGGELPPALPSTIVRCGPGPVRILREGVIDREALERVVEVA